MILKLEDRIQKQEGTEFNDLFEDINPIHRVGEVVQGMQLASHLMKYSIQRLLPGKSLSLKHMEAKFPNSAIYDEILYFYPKDLEPISNSEYSLSGNVTNSNGTVLMKMECKFSQDLAIDSEIRHSELEYKRDIPNTLFERFCRNIRVVDPTSNQDILRSIFFTNFVAGAICQTIRERIPKDKMVFFGQQTVDFHYVSRQDFSTLNMFLRIKKESEGVLALEEECYLDSNHYFSGKSLLIKKNQG